MSLLEIPTRCFHNKVGIFQQFFKIFINILRLPVTTKGYNTVGGWRSKYCQKYTERGGKLERGTVGRGEGAVGRGKGGCGKGGGRWTPSVTKIVKDIFRLLHLKVARLCLACKIFNANFSKLT